MNRNPSLTILAAALFGALALAGCRQQPAEPVEPAAAPAAETPPPFVEEPEAPAAAVEVTDVQLGTEVGDDRSIAEPATSFSAEDHTILAAVTTSSGDPNSPVTASLGARWTFQDGQLVDERSESLSFTGQDITNFRVTNPEPWAMGTYTLEISLDGEVVETRQFTVQ